MPIKLACNGRSKNLPIKYPQLPSAVTLVGQNTVHDKEILNTLIIIYGMLWDKGLVRTGVMFGRFRSSELLTEFEIEIRKKLNIFFWYLKKYMIKKAVF